MPEHGRGKQTFLINKKKNGNLQGLRERRQSTEYLVVSSWGIRQTSMHRFCPAS